MNNGHCRAIAGGPVTEGGGDSYQEVMNHRKLASLSHGRSSRNRPGPVRLGVASCAHRVVGYGESRMLRNPMLVGGRRTGSGPRANRSLHYFAGDDTLTVSDLDNDHYLKLTRTGQRVWVLGGSTHNSFSGDGATWSGGQHGHHVLAADRLLVFNNGALGSNSTAIEIQLDLASMTASRVWSYSGGYGTVVMGDVQRLSDGNTLVTYSQSGVIQEIRGDSTAREFSWPIGGALGYSMYRASLCGPPPK